MKVGKKVLRVGTFCPDVGNNLPQVGNFLPVNRDKTEAKSQKKSQKSGEKFQLCGAERDKTETFSNMVSKKLENFPSSGVQSVCVCLVPVNVPI